MRSARERDRPRYVSLAVRGPTTVLWKLPESYRVLSYGDLAQDERRRRWIARRWMLAGCLLVVSYLLASGPWMAAIRKNAIPSAGLPAKIIEYSFLPVKVAGHLCPPLGMAMRSWHAVCDSLFVQKSITGRWQPTPLWWLWVAVWIVIAYALSPVPVWLSACLLAIERQSAVSSLMSLGFAPLVLLADLSTNVREFYEAYGDWRETID